MWTAEQLRAAEAKIEQQKREFEANRLAALKKVEEDERRAKAEENDMLTYSREDAKNQVNSKKSTRTKPVSRRLLGIKRASNVSKRRPTLLEQALKKTQRVQRNNPRIVATANSPSKQRRLSPLPSSNDVRATRATRRMVVTAGARIRRTLSPRQSDEQRAKRPKTSARSESNGAVDADADAIDADDDRLRNNHADSKYGSESGYGARSDEFNDSEASLDVMIAESDGSARSMGTPTSASAAADSDAANDTEDENDDDDTTINNEDVKENLLSRSLNTVVGNHIDENSPRTRSHGRVKIDLWSLQESQVLPDCRGGRPRHSNTHSGTNVSKHDAEDAASNGAGDDDDNDGDDDDDNNSTTATHDANADLTSDNDEQNDDRLETKSKPCIDVENCDNRSVENSNKLKNAVRTVKQANNSVAAVAATKTKKSSKNVLKNISGKNQMTIDNYIQMSHKSPKIILNKDECNINSTAATRRPINDLKRNRATATAAGVTTANHSKNHSGHDVS